METNQSYFGSSLKSVSSVRNKTWKSIVIQTAATLIALTASAGYYGNHLLLRGDEVVLTAPMVSFYSEIERMNLGSSRFHAVPLEQDETYAMQSANAEARDLAASLKKAKLPQEETSRLSNAHALAREKLTRYQAELDAWKDSGFWVVDDNGYHRDVPVGQKPNPPALSLPDDLPQEFALYLKGVLRCETSAVLARESWEELLALVPSERHWKSTWAAFRLGKSSEKDEPKKATEYFRQVRELAQSGFADSIGLAVASLGLEARINLKRGNYQEAIRLYLEQLGAGDDSALESLRCTAAEAVQAGGQALEPLARDRNAQKVITAYLISSAGPNAESNLTAANIFVEWLRLVEAAKLPDAASAEQLAVAAYRSGDAAVADTWIKRAGHSAVADWLRAKLLARSGKLEQAAGLLARTVVYFPVAAPNQEKAAPDFKDELFVGHSGHPAARHITGELGALRVALGQFPESVDSLLRGGFWEDAAYVGERVLTLDELKNYVDSYWSPVSDQQQEQERALFARSPGEEQCDISPIRIRENIRYLLARRLTRELRGNEARPYYPPEHLADFDYLCNALRIGWDTSAAANSRAQALFAAAKVARARGMELLGTEVQPDWHNNDGYSEDCVTWEARASNRTEAKSLRATKEELRRAEQHHADPEQRFHYRYQAAFLAWEAAKLMPNNDEQTAQTLCLAGSWLKNRDPETADIFYKALVRRNRHTKLGDEADLRHWFPDVDEAGNLMPRIPAPFLAAADAPEPASEGDITSGSESTSPDEGTNLVEPAEQTGPVPDQEPSSEAASTQSETDENTQEMSYTIERGDTLASIVRRAVEAGLQITVQDLLSANPELQPTRLRIGQEIAIPLTR
jgi:hypothetical protein